MNAKTTGWEIPIIIGVLLAFAMVQEIFILIVDWVRQLI